VALVLLRIGHAHYQRLSLIVALTLAACGGAQDSNDPHNAATGDGGDGGGGGSRDGGGGSRDGGGVECSYVKVVKSFSVPITHDAICTLETAHLLDDQGGMTLASPYVTSPKRCAELCNDPDANSCTFPSDALDKYDKIYAVGGARDPDAGSAACPFADAVGDQTLACAQTEIDYYPSSGGCPVDGRRPDGYRASTPRGEGAIARYLSASAQLEAASVIAFEDLRRELALHGAPRELLDACTRAAEDEVRHAREVGALARRCGGEVPEPCFEGRATSRPLVALAIENMGEGCVRELYGAA
jgi:hypothetical protein